MHTFALHIAAVQVMLGAGALTRRGAFSAITYWRRLAAAMLTTSKIAVSVAIVLGVAPLLFVQVVYDPFWYTSNVLSAWWVIGFIMLLIAGYIAMYVFYWKNHDIVAEGGPGGGGGGRGAPPGGLRGGSGALPPAPLAAPPTTERPCPSPSTTSACPPCAGCWCPTWPPSITTRAPSP